MKYNNDPKSTSRITHTPRIKTRKSTNKEQNVYDLQHINTNNLKSDVRCKYT